MISIGGRDVATLVWKHERNADVDLLSSSQMKTTARSVSASPNAGVAKPVSVRHQRGESDDSGNTDSEEEGYDSDVQHDRSMDYNARILIHPKRDKKEAPRPTTTMNKKPLYDKHCSLSF